MADILPSRPDPPDDDKEPRVVGIDSEGVEDLLSAISSDTARSILAELHEEPATPSEVADRADTSIQNAQYHLGKLDDTGLVEEAGTAYSEKGREMTVYAPADRALVVVAGQEGDASGLQTALSQLLSGLGVVALGSVVVDRLARRGDVSLSVGLGSGGSDGGSGGGGAGGGARTGADGQSADLNATTGDSTATTTTAARDTATPAGDSGAATRTETAAGAPTDTATESDGGFRIAEATQTPEETRTEAARTVRETAEATREPTDAATAAPTQTPQSTPTPASELEQTTRAVTDSGGTAGDPLTTLGTAVASLSPGELFLLGGLVAVLAVGAYWWIRN